MKDFRKLLLLPIVMLAFTVISIFTACDKLPETTKIDTSEADNSAIALTKGLVEDATYSAVQANVTNIMQAKAAVQTIIGGLRLNGVTTMIIDGAFMNAIAGASSNITGMNGSYNFTVELNKGMGTKQTTDELTLTIMATVYVDTTASDNAAIADAKSALHALNLDNLIYNQSQGNTHNSVRSFIMFEVGPDIATTYGVSLSLTNGLFSPATAGTINSPTGANGSAAFIIDIEKGTGTPESITFTVIIIATPYTSLNSSGFVLAHTTHYTD